MVDKWDISFPSSQALFISSLVVVIPSALHQGANLQGVKMLCSNAEGASLRGCNFEDPAGIKANLEGDDTHYLTLSKNTHTHTHTHTHTVTHTVTHTEYFVFKK